MQTYAVAIQQTFLGKKMSYRQKTNSSRNETKKSTERKLKEGRRVMAKKRKVARDEWENRNGDVLEVPAETLYCLNFADETCPMDCAFDGACPHWIPPVNCQYFGQKNCLNRSHNCQADGLCKKAWPMPTPEDMEMEPLEDEFDLLREGGMVRPTRGFISLYLWGFTTPEVTYLFEKFLDENPEQKARVDEYRDRDD